MTRYTVTLMGSMALITLTANCSPNSGPATTTGSATGGTSSTGGASESGGSGGTTTTGSGGNGLTATGGIAPSTGGSSAVGTGGTIGTGGGGSGGRVGSGGSASGGVGSGGAVGSGGVAASGGAGGGGPAVACPNGAVFCDDFESYANMTAPPAPKWKSWNVGAGTLVVDTAEAFSGTKAVHVHGQVSQSGGTKQQAFMLAQGASVFPVSGNTIYIRFMIFGTRFPFTGFSGANHTVFSWVGSSKALNSPDQGETGKAYNFADYNGVSIEPQWMGYYRDTSVHFKDANQANKWHCWEYEIDNAGGPPAGASGAAMPHIWEDDVELKLVEAGGNAPYNAVPFEGVMFGLWSPQTDTAAADFWFDDVAISKSRINCPAAK